MNQPDAFSFREPGIVADLLVQLDALERAEFVQSSQPLFSARQIADLALPQEGLVGRRPSFEAHPMPALINWILRERSGWKQFITEPNKEAAFLARGLIYLLAYQVASHGYLPPEISSLTLLCRRLLWFSSRGIDFRNRMGLTLSLHSGGAWRLPRPDVFVSQGTSETSDPFVVCTQSTVDAFIRNLLPFLNGSHVFQSKTGNSIRELAKDRGLDFYLSDRGSGLGFAAEPILENSLNRAGINSVHAAATSLLAPNPRGLVASSYMLHPERIFHLETLKSRIGRREDRVLPGLIACLTGMSLREMVDVSLFAPSSEDQIFEHLGKSQAEAERYIPGWICSGKEAFALGVCGPLPEHHDRYYLITHVGPARCREFDSRIRNQLLVLPLPTQLNGMVRDVRWSREPKGGIITFGDVLAWNALEVIRRTLVSTYFPAGVRDRALSPWVNESIATYLRRPDRAFLYVACVQARIPPARLNLIFGRPISPWRASSNYACVEREDVAKDVERVQHALMVAAGWKPEQLDWPRPLVLGNAGAGLIVGRKIGRPGLISSAKLAVETPIGDTSLIHRAASLDYIKRLFGCRYSGPLPNPSQDFIPTLGAYAFVDKNISGKRYPRVVPIPKEAIAILKTESWTKLPSVLPVENDDRLAVRKFRVFGEDPNAGRKALYSALLTKNIGDEAISSVFGHGLALTKIFGPISPLPGFWFLEQIRGALSELRIAQAIPDGARCLSKPVTFEDQISLIQWTEHRESQHSRAAEGAAIDGVVQHLPIPTTEQFDFCNSLLEAILNHWEEHLVSPISARRCLFLLATLAALPFGRAWTLKSYLRGDSFVVRKGGKGEDLHYLIAPILQRDRGIGFVPIPIPLRVGIVCQNLVRHLSALRKKGKSKTDTNGHWRILNDVNTHSFGHILRQASGLDKCGSGPRNEQWVRAALNATTKFWCRSRYGALLFNSLNGRGLVPPNYFAIEDIFFQADASSEPLRKADGELWQNHFGVSNRQKARGGRVDRANKPIPFAFEYRGLPMKKLPKIARWIGNRISPIDATSCIEWFRQNRRFFERDRPREKTVEKVELSYRRSGLRVARALLLRGKLSEGRPEHLLWPEQTERFLKIFSDRLLKSRGLIRRHSAAADWWVKTILFLGCRPTEARLIRGDHVDDRGRPRILRIPGTKTKNAPRTVDLFLFRQDLTGQLLFQKCVGETGWQIASNVRFPKGGATFQRALNRVLHECYEKLRQELHLPPATGTFSLNSLRHAAAFRVVQHWVRRSLWGGTFWTQLASVSASLGHQSVVTTWSLYVGTAMLALKWPGRNSSDREFCPLIDPCPQFSDSTGRK